MQFDLKTKCLLDQRSPDVELIMLRLSLEKMRMLAGRSVLLFRPRPVVKKGTGAVYFVSFFSSRIVEIKK
mgnify:FL=1|jgi:hypothetical protein